MKVKAITKLRAIPTLEILFSIFALKTWIRRNSFYTLYAEAVENIFDMIAPKPWKHILRNTMRRGENFCQWWKERDSGRSAGKIGILFIAEEAFVEKKKGKGYWRSASGIAVLLLAEKAYGKK